MKYAIRSNKGHTFTNTEWGINNGKEITHDTYGQAEGEMKVLQQSFKDVELKIIEIEG